LHTGDAHLAYTRFCNEVCLDPISQRAFSDLLYELDMYGYIRARTVSRGRYGRTKEIHVSLDPNVRATLVRQIRKILICTPRWRLFERRSLCGVLDPFAHWNIAATYERYSAFFDVVIYCTIFIALSHVLFLRRFPGRPGKVLATAIGLALGISLAVAGQQYGFSLRAAGPIAVFLALLLVGFLVFYTLLHIQ